MFIINLYINYILVNTIYKIYGMNQPTKENHGRFQEIISAWNPKDLEKKKLLKELIVEIDANRDNFPTMSKLYTYKSKAQDYIGFKQRFLTH